MIWAYVVIMAMTTPVTSETTFVVNAPNMAFKNEEDCQTYRELNMLYLFQTRPTPKARAVSQCVPLPFNVDQGA